MVEEAGEEGEDGDPELIWRLMPVVLLFLRAAQIMAPKYFGGTTLEMVVRATIQVGNSNTLSKAKKGIVDVTPGNHDQMRVAAGGILSDKICFPEFWFKSQLVPNLPPHQFWDKIITGDKFYPSSQCRIQALQEARGRLKILFDNGTMGFHSRRYKKFTVPIIDGAPLVDYNLLEDQDSDDEQE